MTKVRKPTQTPTSTTTQNTVMLDGNNCKYSPNENAANLPAIFLNSFCSVSCTGQKDRVIHTEHFSGHLSALNPTERCPVQL